MGNDTSARQGHGEADAPDAGRREWLSTLIGGVAATTLLACENGTVEEEAVSEVQDALGADLQSVAALRALVVRGGNPTRLLLGHTTASDGGGGLFAWKVLPNALPPVEDNGVTIVKSNLHNGRGRWVRIGTLSTLSELRAMPTPSNSGSGFWHVLGYHKLGDGGGGTFFWDPSSTAPDNGGTLIAPGTNPASGRWRRIYDGPINVRWFGARGDNVADDAPAFRGAVAAASAASASTGVFVPAGTYRMLSTVTEAATERAAIILTDGLKLFGQGEKSILYWPGGSPVPYPPEIPPPDPMTYDVIVANGSNITISDLAFHGANGEENGAGYVQSENYWRAAINGGSRSNVQRPRENLTIERCRFQNLYGRPARDASGEISRTRFCNNVCYYCGNGVLLSGSDSCHLDNILVSSEGIETSGSRVQIRGNHLSGKTAVISVTGELDERPTHQVTIANNVLDLSQVAFGLVGIIVTGVTGVSITANAVSNAPEMGIQASRSSRITITGNTIRRDTPPAPNSTSGIFLSSTTDSVVSANVVDGGTNMLYGINALGVSRVTVEGNSVQGMTNAGIYVRDGSDLTIAGNQAFQSVRGVQLQLLSGAILMGNRLLGNTVTDLVIEQGVSDVRLALNRYDSADLSGGITYNEGNG